MIIRKWGMALLCLGFTACTQATAAITVVLDPGHGGKLLPPVSVYGDKFDPLTGRYQDRFREGAIEEGIWEHEVMYEIAQRVQAILMATQDANRHEEFRRILGKYGTPPVKINSIKVEMSRKPSYIDRYEEAKVDLNAEYRLYNYEDIYTGKILPGTISRINAFKPDLVVTLHLTGSNPGPNGALAAVITPSYYTYKIARDYVNATPKERLIIKKNFLSSPYGTWFRATPGYNHWESFMVDAWIYFTGYWPMKDGLSVNLNKYRGYRQNMFTWAYRDEDGWENKVGQSPGPYALDLRNFKAEGPFWQREQSEPEQWRRENGPEGYGGDNLFAAHEIFRFIRKGFLVNKVDTPQTLPPIIKPYLSTWAVPTFINAISAYLEIAHLGAERDRQRMLYYRNIYAESIAVGIYALFYPFPIENNGLPQMPTGQPLHIDKYHNHKDGNYFTKVVP